LFNAGDAAECGYVVQEGSFVLKSDSKSLGEVIAEPGTLLGELALVAQTKRPATATARESSTVIRISRSLFLKMLEGYPEAAEILRDQILARTRQSIAEVADVRAMLGVSEAPR
jgi:CRP-like cAMP-binding protein